MRKMSKLTKDMGVNEIWDRLKDIGVEEQTLQIVTDINGFTKETLLDVLYAYSGYRNFEQMESEEERE